MQIELSHFESAGSRACQIWEQINCLLSQKDKKKSYRKGGRKNKCHSSCFITVSSLPESVSSGIGHLHPPTTMFENNISTTYAFFSTLFSFVSPSSHRTTEHCHKHGCYSKCWPGVRKTLRYSLDLLHEVLPSYYMCKFTLPGEGRGGWQGRSDNTAAGWIHGCRRGKRIDRGELNTQRRRELYNYCAAAATSLKHSFIFVSLQVSKTDTQELQWGMAI